jgi:hypothetical protein
MADVAAAGIALDQSDTPYHRRAYVRAVFAWLEGDIFQWRFLALYRHDNIKPTFSNEAELFLLREKRYSLDKRGKPKEYNEFLSPFAESMRFSFEMFTYALEVSYQLDVGNHGWEALQWSVDIRNKITHPKNIGDLEITDSQLEQVRKAVVWYREQNRELAEEVNKKVVTVS